MRLSYTGKGELSNRRVAILEFSNKEDKKATFVCDYLFKKGYDCSLVGDDEKCGAYFKVDDKDDFEFLKSMYEQAKKEFKSFH